MSRPTRSRATRALAALLDVLYPPACPICRGPPAPGEDFCSPCLRDVPGMGAPACGRCARRTGPHLPRGRRCSRCRGEGIGVDRIVAAAAYEGPVRDLIHRFKFRKERSLGPPLGRWIARALDTEGLRADLIAPVPLHWRRAWLRGYNQAEILAEAVSRELRVPLTRGLLVRVRATGPQSRLSGGRGRRANVRGAFAPGGPSCRGRTVILVDDVLSTGATMAQCGEVLRKAGAVGIIGATVAR